LDFKKKILELQPTELMVLITVLLVMLEVRTSMHILVLWEFLIKDITISLLVMSTFKLFIFFLLCFVIAYIIFQLGVLLAFILNVILSFFNFENIKEHSSLLWIFVASLPSLFFLVYCLQYEDFRSLILLIFLAVLH
jgi:hypothetical protein